MGAYGAMPILFSHSLLIITSLARFLCVGALVLLLLQIFHKATYAIELLRNADALWAMWLAVSAAHTVVGLSQFGHTTVIPHGSSAKARLTINGEQIFVTNVFIGEYGIGKQREGDRKTPQGTLHAKRAFGIPCRNRRREGYRTVPADRLRISSR